MQALLTGVGDGPNTGEGLSVVANSTTGVLHYQITSDNQVNVELYDLRGALVSTLVQEYQSAGQYEINWPTKNDQGFLLASGVYFFRISAGEAVRSGKVVVVK